MYNEIALDFIEKNKDKLNNNNFDFFYLNLPSGVTSNDLTKIFIDANINFLNYLSYIYEDTFAQLHIYDIYIPNNITEIKDYAFYQCDINEIIIPKSVSSIGKKAFLDCPNLTKVWLPKLTYLGVDAFQCDNLTDIYYEGSERDWMNLTTYHLFDYYLNPNITKVHFNSY